MTVRWRAGVRNPGQWGSGGDMARISDRAVGGRYRLVSELGRGGMGTVWAAHDELLDREVAVKEVVPPPDLPAEQREVLRQRTLREARAAARITSGAAVTVYDVVEEDGRPWIVMERLEAQTLAQIIRDRGPLPPAEAAAVGLRVLEALDAAHAAGVLHRDVKPSNVLVTAGGRAVLSDFGIATLEGDPSLTSTGMIVGSPAYMAPERIRGEPPTRASDLWSLGATLFTAVEGRAPFEREGHIATLTAAVTEPPPPAPHAGALAPILDGLLTTDPAERIDASTARAMLAQASRTLQHATTASLPSVPAAAVEHDAQASRTQALPVLPVPGPDAGADAGPEPLRYRPADPPRRRGGAGWLLPALALLLALSLGGLWLALGDRDGVSSTSDRPGSSGSSPRASDPATSASPSGEASEEPTPDEPTPDEPTPSETDDESEPATGVPEGFRLHRDPTGFAVAVPDGWRERRQGTRVYFDGPDGRFLQIDQTDDPKGDPVADWRRQERSVSQRVPGYELLGIEAVDYRGWPAADWEFLRDSASGTRLHVRNRAVVTDPEDHAYALYWSVPEDDWDDALETFDAIAASFRPAD